MSSTPERHVVTADDRRLVVTWFAWFLRCVTAAAMATAVLYALSVGTLPEPIVGAATAVSLAALIATAVIAAGLEQPRAVMQRPYEPAVTAGRLEPPHAPSRPPSAARSIPPLDLSDYARAERGRRQCPHCGSFAVTTSKDAAQQANTCRTCGQVWRSGAGLPEPDVVVRSWLHR
jgi:hypothetical protein